jgi:hypothetical protein
MSKQSDAKEAQGYDPKPIPQICKNCACFTYESVFSYEYLGIKYFKDKNFRCS